ncbi:MAG: crossover junction endodeoxyribonuclease RuvC [Actinobacteria bacterium]|nr:crossover junction endodeoxyribonuclease RuvC [Actinomycetota bacterium]NDI09818.1 crossover junction endodeoxyribonuclease RuvC [Actinomycetota bacterium]
MRVLGVDPGLTRCGIGVVDRIGQKLSLVDLGVIRTPKESDLAARLLELDHELTLWIKRAKPDVIAIERVFSQLNVKTAMATGQAAGVAILLAAKSGLPIALHTPSEVKAAVTGSGRADKRQVATMVKRILSLQEMPKPVDTTDALALAICHHWRGAGNARIDAALKRVKSR